MEKNGVIMSKSISCPRIAYPDGCISHRQNYFSTTARCHSRFCLLFYKHILSFSLLVTRDDSYCSTQRGIQCRILIAISVGYWQIIIQKADNVFRGCKHVSVNDCYSVPIFHSFLFLYISELILVLDMNKIFVTVRLATKSINKLQCLCQSHTYCAIPNNIYETPQGWVVTFFLYKIYINNWDVRFSVLTKNYHPLEIKKTKHYCFSLFVHNYTIKLYNNVMINQMYI